MTIILLLALALFLAVAFQVLSFLLTCLVVGFKLSVVAVVSFLVYKCVLTYRKAGR